MRATMMTMLTMALATSSFLASSAFNGCGRVDEIFDCQSVCSRYRDCYQADYDVSACRSSCRSRSQDDPVVRSAADDCEACIGGKSCLSATFSCPSCSNVVP
jgi:hypothetical protein